jgi:hypothetical protein
MEGVRGGATCRLLKTDVICYHNLGGENAALQPPGSTEPNVHAETLGRGSGKGLELDPNVTGFHTEDMCLN